MGKWVNRIVDAVTGGLAFFSGFLLVLIMLCVTADVIMRYFLNKPMFWVGELTEYALLYVTFAGTAWVLKKDTHVKIDILNVFLGPREMKILGVFSGIIGIIVCLVLTYYGTKVTLDHFQRGVYNPTLLEFPKGPLLMVIPIGTFLLLIQFIKKTWNNLSELRGR